MSQTFTAFTGSTDLGDTPTIINANFDAIRSNWAGTSAPGSPVVGQPFYNTTTGKITIWDGSSWVDSANTSTTVLANTAELLAARGTAANLNARLSVAMNPDGTLKDTLPVGDWWMDEGDIVEYVSSSSFTVEGDKTAIYIENRALFLIQATSEYNYVVSSSYSSGTDLTTVTTLNENVDSGLSSVQYGQPVENAPVVTVTSIGAEPADVDILKADTPDMLQAVFGENPQVYTGSNIASLVLTRHHLLWTPPVGPANIGRPVPPYDGTYIVHLYPVNATSYYIASQYRLPKYYDDPDITADEVRITIERFNGVLSIVDIRNMWGGV
jgi:hypothetical protein